MCVNVKNLLPCYFPARVRARYTHVVFVSVPQPSSFEGRGVLGGTRCSAFLSAFGVVQLIIGVNDHFRFCSELCLLCNNI